MICQSILRQLSFKFFVSLELSHFATRDTSCATVAQMQIHKQQISALFNVNGLSFEFSRKVIEIKQRLMLLKEEYI